MRASRLDWVLVQPVHLTDGRDAGLPRWSIEGEQWTATVTRRAVGAFLVRSLEDASLTHRTVALSGSGGPGKTLPERDRERVGG